MFDYSAKRQAPGQLWMRRTRPGSGWHVLRVRICVYCEVVDRSRRVGVKGVVVVVVWFGLDGEGDVRLPAKLCGGAGGGRRQTAPAGEKMRGG